LDWRYRTDRVTASGAISTVNIRSAGGGRIAARVQAALGLSIALGVGGCASAPAMIGTVSGVAAPATTDATAVDPGLAQSLETAPSGARIIYRLPDGFERALVIGPLYQSGRGVPCRLGRAGPPLFGASVPTTYPFCRIDNQWYAMKPVVISGY
jgi:hypothetical protein